MFLDGNDGARRWQVGLGPPHPASQRPPTPPTPTPLTPPTPPTYVQVLVCTFELPAGTGFGITLVDDGDEEEGDMNGPDGCQDHRGKIENFATPLCHEAGMQVGDRLHRLNGEALFGLDWASLTNKVGPTDSRRLTPTHADSRRLTPTHADSHQLTADSAAV